MFHNVQRRRLMPLVQEFEQAEFEQQHNFFQWKDDRKQQHDSADKPISVLQEFNGSAENARLL